MEEGNNLKQRVEEAVATFAYEYMGVTPKSVVVDIHSGHVLTTLRGIIPPVEKDYAEGEPEGRDLLEKCYNSVFDATKKSFETLLGNILGQVIQSSMLSVNPKSGDGVMIFNLADSPPD